MKRFISLLMATLMLAIVSTTAWAAEPNKDSLNFEGNEIDYMHYDFPFDAVILYQGEDGVVYQSKMEEPNKPASVTGMEYNGVWVDKGKHTYGTISVKNPHTIINTTSGIINIESEASNVSMDVVLHAGIELVFDGTIKASQGDIHFNFLSHASELTIQYYTNTVSSQHGMRLNCWLW